MGRIGSGSAAPSEALVADSCTVDGSSSIHESRTLAALRDMLLPKLISGELRVGTSTIPRR